MKYFSLSQRIFSALCFIVCVSLPLGARAESSDASLEVSGWIPYWRAEEGVKDAKKHLDTIDTIYPFAFTVKSDGKIADLAHLSKSHWKSLFKDAREKDIEIIPTVMMSDGTLTHTLLSSPKKRKKHVASIVSMVEKGKYDGVDIDYEAKKAETKDYFSLFLKELKEKLGDGKLLVCTIEPRTPPESLYKEIPNPLKYSNDYVELNKYCDRIQLMTYDQQRADIKLNEERAGLPYMPIADVDWVRKVVKLALESFPKEKVMLGIPTYGYNYRVTVAPNWFRDYGRIGALNAPDILDLADEYHVKPSRNSAGEMGFTYLHASSTVKFPKNLKIPKNTPSGMKVAAQALAYANKTGEEVVFRLLSWSDAGAIEQKADLAKEFGLQGVTLFKIDGEEDAGVWKFLK